MQFLKKLFQNSVGGFIAVLLGVAGLLFDVAGIAGVTGWLADLVRVVDVLLVAMGFRDILLVKKQNLLDLIADWRSNTFWGTILSQLAPLFVKPELLPGASPELVEALRIIGYFMLALGITGAGARGKFALKSSGVVL